MSSAIFLEIHITPIWNENFILTGTFTKFLDEHFDAKAYANSIIQSRAIGESLAKLSDGVSILDKELNDQVSSRWIFR